MTDNVAITAGSGTTIAADDIGSGILAQRVKPVWGPDGTGNDVDVATGKPMPVQVRSATGLIPLGEPTDAKATATDTTSVSAISLLKQISASVQAPPSQAVTNAGTFAAQVTAASGSIASGAVASGAFASGSIASGAVASGAVASGAMVDLGAIADAAVTAGATGSLSAKLRSISRDLVANIVLAAGANLIGKVTVASPSTDATTNPTSTLTLTSSTTAYTPAQNVANNATAGSVTVSSFAIANSAGAAQIGRLRLTTNDSVSTGWAGQSVQIDLWSTAPTFTNGDHAAYVIATGSAGYLGSFTGTFAAIAGDGTYATLSPTVGNACQIKLGSGTSVFWTMQTLTGSGVITASKVMTLTAEVIN